MFQLSSKGHFATECKEPRVEQNNAERRIVTVQGVEGAAGGTATSQAIVA